MKILKILCFISLLGIAFLLGNIINNDFVGSYVGKQITPMGEIYVNNNATTTVITTQDTYTKVMASTTEGHVVSGEFQQSADGRLQYIGKSTKDFHCGITLSATMGVAAQEMSFALYKNGTLNANNEYTDGTELVAGNVPMTLNNANSTYSNAIHAMTQLSQNDYVELAVKNETGTTNVVVIKENLFCMGTVFVNSN
jgi:hypothetical protein